MWSFKFDLKKLIVWSLILFLFAPALFSYLNGGVKDSSITITQAMADIREGKIEKVEVLGDSVVLNYPDKEIKLSTKETGQSFTELLTQYEIDPNTVNFEIANGSFLDKLGSILNILSFVLMALFLVMIFRQMRGGNGGAGGGGMFGMGKSKAKLFAKGKQNVKFDDVAGVDEAKAELVEVVDFLKNPEKYKKVGARTPKGVLLVGPAGVGKTLMARAVAGEAGVSFFSMAGSEFMEMLVGVGASRVRDLFETAKKAAPAIIFIDEIDAIGRTRGYGSMGGHDERDQTLNQILVEMDGFAANESVIVMAATNRPDVLDQALIRPGRFDRRVTLDMPDIEGRKAILAIHAVGKPFAKDLNWTMAARRTVGFSGADLENMLNEAAIKIARENRKEITFADIEDSATKVKLGPEKKRMFNKEEREMTAYHEAGHAVVTHFLAHTDPVHRISIVSRGQALGFTLIPPDQDKYQKTRTELLEEICTLLGGRAAEKLVYDELTAGASSDIDKVTRIARAMVVDYGMSALGPIDFGQSELSEWGRTYMEQSDVSDSKRSEIDSEVKRIVTACEKVAGEVLRNERKAMDAVVIALMERESLEREEFEKIVKVTKEQIKKTKKYKVVYS
ncbi:cell division protein FtsH [Candidatus Collierbacteria bacterium RIFOXYA1_FULL_46_24]|uniref:ATP-dependent zinc metalloprotease FtsH n=2 Tax=Candidatus Collieribacteriota TaxID=1752725 RepID=A0A1F5FYQ1_9BACT|nr:MAG: cell division protein FtsH [Candidatus Collierbacteria bacterium RIFOXYA1_FULL_46_24]OGD74257.1 MAG: cell division protein FtsH [Candidatus Collierbacteria bacterium RIFOXYA2_FULL_46_10]OGD84737.1 MAG: cell division protein FtsH [Candidatus Collierbacteria bacterium RIFOXYD1_FULL_46_26]